MYWDWEVAFVLCLLVLAIVSFVAERITTDQTALAIFGLLLLASQLPATESLPSLPELFSVFASEAPLAIAGMFILSAALEKTGVIERLARALGSLTRLGFTGLLLATIGLVGAGSAFINNTPIVVIFLPVVLSLARTLETPASKLLIPLSYASIFGGTCTLVGTSTNILASGIMVKHDMAPLAMFELGAVGLPLLLLGTLYLATVGQRLLPRRESLMAVLSEEERREFLTEAFVPANSPLIGKDFRAGPLAKERGLRLLELIRDDVALPDPSRAELQAGDRLILSVRPSGLAAARNVPGLNLGVEAGLETISAHEGSIVEGIIGPRSSIAGASIRELNFRQRFRMIILAVHRRGINLRDKLDTLPLQIGDTILMMGTDQAREQMRKGDDILLLDQPATPTSDRRKKAPIVLVALGLVITAATFQLMPIAGAVLLAVALIVLTGCLSPKEAYGAVDWSILVLIYGMLALGMSMERTGAAQLVASGLAQLSTLGFPEAWRSLVMLAAVYLVSSIFTEMLSNNATVVLMAPIAFGLAQTLGLDPRPFVIAVTIASSASFATPIGYQTNTYVYSAGGYRFADFLKVGIPLNLLYFAGSMVLIPLFWDI